MPEQIVLVVLSAIVIVVFAVERFNTPPADPKAGLAPYRVSRSTTTAASYYTAVSLYSAIALAVLLFLLVSPTGVNLLTQMMAPGTSDSIPPWARQSPALLIALILTVLLPKIPVLSAMDKWFRTQLQRFAAIPHEVRRLGAEIRRAPFRGSSERQQEVLKFLTAQGFDPADVRFEESSAPHYHWAKLSLLMRELDDWNADARFVSYVLTYPNEFNTLRQRYDALLLRARKCFNLLRDLATDPDPAKKGGAAYAYRDDFVEEADDLLKAVYEAISNAVLLCEFTERARVNRLIKLGFILDPKRPRRLTLNELLGLFTGITVLFALWFVVIWKINPTHGPLNPANLVLAIMIAAIYCLAIWCAIYPKTRWSAARRNPQTGRPFGWYLLSGLLATASGAPLSFLYQIWNHHPSLRDAWGAYWQDSPWGLMTFATAYSLAFLADDVTREPYLNTARRLRWAESIGLMVVMAVTGWIVQALLQSALVSFPNPPPRQSLPKLEVLLVMPVGIGFAIGFLVPSWYRTAPREAPREVPHAVREAAPALRE